MNIKWSEEEKNYLIANVHSKSDKVIAEEMRRMFKKSFTTKSVEHFRRSMGIMKSRGRHSKVVGYKLPSVALVVIGGN